MNYGLYLSASGVLTNIHRQDVVANNLANVQTAGFKRDVPVFRQRLAESIAKGLGGEYGNEVLDAMGGGAWAGPTRTSFEHGPMMSTQNNMDAALNGMNAFFALGGTDPKTGEPSVELTRDGRFRRSDDGYLVNTSGKRVLDTGDSPIALTDQGEVMIGSDGGVSQNGQLIARVQVTGVTDLTALVKQGQGNFKMTGSAERVDADNSTLSPAHVEGSAVDAVKAMVDMINTNRAINNNATMIRYHDTLMDRAVNTLGRVA